MKVAKAQESNHSETIRENAGEETPPASGGAEDPWKPSEAGGQQQAGGRSAPESQTFPDTENLPEASVRTDSPGNDTKAEAAEDRKSTRMRSGLSRGLDRFAILCLKAAAFGIVAALAGIATTIVLQNYASQDTVLPITEELGSQGQRMSEIESQLTALAETVGQLAENEQVTALADSLQAELSGLRERLAMLEESQAASEESLGSVASQLGGQLGEFGQEISALESRLAKIESAPPVPAPVRHSDGFETVAAPADPGVGNLIADLEGQFAASAGRLTNLQSDLTALTRQVEQLETREPSADPTTVGQLESLAAGLAEFGERLAKTEQDLLNLAAVPVGEPGSAAAMTLVAIRAAADTGAPYERLINDAGLSDSQLPEILAANAATGVSTLEELRRNFDAVAREALKAESVAADENGVTGYLRSLVRVRPLTPQEGDSSAAILSRADATLEAGDLASALQLLATLPEAGREAFSEWTRAAQTRLDVMVAFDSLLVSPEN